MLVGEAKALNVTTLLALDWVQLTLADSVENLGVILGPTLLLEKHVNAVAKRVSSQLSLVQKCPLALIELI